LQIYQYTHLKVSKDSLHKKNFNLTVASNGPDNKKKFYQPCLRQQAGLRRTHTLKESVRHTHNRKNFSSHTWDSKQALGVRTHTSCVRHTHSFDYEIVKSQYQ